LEILIDATVVIEPEKIPIRVPLRLKLVTGTINFSIDRGNQLQRSLNLEAGVEGAIRMHSIEQVPPVVLGPRRLENHLAIRLHDHWATDAPKFRVLESGIHVAGSGAERSLFTDAKCSDHHR